MTPRLSIRIAALALAAMGIHAAPVYGEDSLAQILQDWSVRHGDEAYGEYVFLIERQDRSSNFGTGPNDESSPVATGNRVTVQIGEGGYLLNAVCPPPYDITEPQIVSGVDQLGYAKTFDSYMDALGGRFQRGQGQFVAQPYTVAIAPEKETHFWIAVDGAYSCAAVVPPWRADHYFQVPTFAWLPDALRTWMGMVSAGGTDADSGHVEISEQSAFDKGVRCLVVNQTLVDESRVYWVDSSRENLVRRCFILDGGGRLLRQYDYQYDDSVSKARLPQSLTILQYTRIGGIHDKLELRLEGFSSRTESVVGEPRIVLPAGTLMIDFPSRTQVLIESDSPPRRVLMRDVALRRNHRDLLVGGTYFSVTRNWWSGVSPTSTELAQALWTWPTIVIAAIAMVAFCLIPAPKERNAPPHPDESGLNHATELAETEFLSPPLASNAGVIDRHEP